MTGTTNVMARDKQLEIARSLHPHGAIEIASDTIHYGADGIAYISINETKDQTPSLTPNNPLHSSQENAILVRAIKEQYGALRDESPKNILRFAQSLNPRQKKALNRRILEIKKEIAHPLRQGATPIAALPSFTGGRHYTSMKTQMVGRVAVNPLIARLQASFIENEAQIGGQNNNQTPPRTTQDYFNDRNISVLNADDTTYDQKTANAKKLEDETIARRKRLQQAGAHHTTPSGMNGPSFEG